MKKYVILLSASLALVGCRHLGENSASKSANSGTDIYEPAGAEAPTDAGAGTNGVFFDRGGTSGSESSGGDNSPATEVPNY